MTALKVRMRSGSDEIEVEGSKSEVEELLRVWWEKLAMSPREATPQVQRTLKKSRTKLRGSRGQDGFDALTIANALKEDKKFGVYEERVLHQKDMYKKIALICRQSDFPITSGQICKVLAALDIRSDQGHVSNTIKSNSGSFILTGVRKKGGAIPKYKLTSKARSDFEAWLNEGQ